MTDREDIRNSVRNTKQQLDNVKSDTSIWLSNEHIIVDDDDDDDNPNNS